MTINLFSSGINTSFSTELNQNSAEFLKSAGRNLVRQLKDRTITISADGGEFSEAYIDSNGRLNSVNTSSSDNTAVYNPLDDTYEPSVSANGDSTTESHGETIATSSSITEFYGIKFTVGSTERVITAATKSASCTATRAQLWDASKNILATASFSGNTATFSNPILLKPSTSYYIVADASGASYTRIANLSASYPYAATNLSFITGYRGDTGSDTSSAIYNLVSITSEAATLQDGVIVHTIPTGSFSATIKSALSTALVKNWESGDNIQFRIKNSSDDTGFLDYNSIKEFTSFSSGEPTELQVKLVVKSTSPTAGYPSIYGVICYGDV